jgi:hypothetical protein
MPDPVKATGVRAKKGRSPTRKLEEFVECAGLRLSPL